MSPQFLGLGRADFITVGAEGPPGERTFYLQAAQGDLLVSLKIEKEHAAALSLGIYQLLEQLGGVSADELLPTNLLLRQPIEPLFRVTSLGLGHDSETDSVLIVARGDVEDAEEAPEVRIWGSRAQMLALAQRAAEVVAAGRPRCLLCGEPSRPGEPHACIRGNGRKWIYRVSESE